MTTKTVKLLDRARNVIATARVTDERGHYGGTIDLGKTHVELLRLFEEFEEVVNGQIFSLLDEVQQKIEVLSLKAVFEDGSEVAVNDLQVFPSTGDVSFKLIGVAA